MTKRGEGEGLKMSSEKSEVPILSVLKNKLQEEAVHGIRRNTGESGRVELINFDEPMVSVKFVLKWLVEAEETLQDKAVVFNLIDEVEITNPEVLAKMTKWVRLPDVIENGE